MTQNGWTRADVCVHWMREIFIPQIALLRKPGQHALLIFDGHQTHESWEMLQLAAQNDVELVRLPAHTTHKLQPLDVGVFGPMQAAWRKQCKDYTARTRSDMPLSQVVKEYLTARTRVIKKSNIKSAWKKSGLQKHDPNVFSENNYGPARLTSTIAFLPSSYPTNARGSGSESESWRPTDISLTNSSDESEPENPPKHVYHNRTPSMSPIAGPSHFPGAYDDRTQPLSPLEQLTGRLSSHLRTPSPPTDSGEQLLQSPQRKLGSSLPHIPGHKITPRRTRSHGFFDQLASPPARKDLRCLDKRSLKQKYHDATSEIERLRHENEVLRTNEVKLRLLLESAETHCKLANQHLAAIQAQNNAKQKNKEKRGSTKAEWLTSETHLAAKALEKEERKKKEEEAKLQREKKEQEEQERQRKRNELCLTGKFKGLPTGKTKDELKDVAQALGQQY